VNIINISIFIIINSVFWNFFCIGPKHRFQIFVFNIHTRIYNSNNDWYAFFAFQ
jgi:hypothetical protein